MRVLENEAFGKATDRSGRSSPLNGLATYLIYKLHIIFIEYFYCIVVIMVILSCIVLEVREFGQCAKHEKDYDQFAGPIIERS